MHGINKCAVLLALAWLTLCALAPGASAQMAIEQARLLLLPHVQAPDTTLQAEVVVETSLEGHPEYLFYGDAWGSYRINAVTGEKLVQHLGQSPLEPGHQPATTLSAAQLRQSAINYVAAHFPGYTPDLFTVLSGEIEPAYDCNVYDVDFVCTAPSGARLPLECRVTVEEDTGLVKTYEERCIPVTISTVPAVSQAQAIAIGQAWIAQNIDPDPSLGEVMTPAEYYPVVLKVEVDPLLNQALVYTIPYQAVVLTIDAQTGAVLSADGWLGGGDRSRARGGKRAKPAETLWKVRLPGGLEMPHGAVAVPGRVFLWHRQAQALGVAVRRDRERVVLTSKGKVVRLPLVRTSPGRRIAAWLRNGLLYLPVAAVRRLTDRVAVDLRERTVTLMHPYARLVSAAPARR